MTLVWVVGLQHSSLRGQEFLQKRLVRFFHGLRGCHGGDRRGPAPDVGELSAGRGHDGGLGGAGQRHVAHVRRLVIANSRVTRDGAVSLEHRIEMKNR